MQWASYGCRYNVSEQRQRRDPMFSRQSPDVTNHRFNLSRSEPGQWDGVIDRANAISQIGILIRSPENLGFWKHRRQRFGSGKRSGMSDRSDRDFYVWISLVSREDPRNLVAQVLWGIGTACRAAFLK